MIGSALFDETTRYRYRLSREWLIGDGTCTFIMLNPSTADADKLDPTVRRCVNYARAWGYRRLEVLNLFAWRSTDPQQLYNHPDPVGPDNYHHITEVAVKSDVVICAWGIHGKIVPPLPPEANGYGKSQHKLVVEMLRAWSVDLYCLGINDDGTPKHPLYLAANLRPYEFVDTLVEAKPKYVDGDIRRFIH